jgi:hypothetical protein
MATAIMLMFFICIWLFFQSHIGFVFGIVVFATTMSFKHHPNMRDYKYANKDWPDIPSQKRGTTSNKKQNDKWQQTTD